MAEFPNAFQSLSAWLHQDADIESSTPVIGWLGSLDVDQRRELKIYVEDALAGKQSVSNLSRAMRIHCKDWKFKQRKLETLFREVVLKELETHA